MCLIINRPEGIGVSARLLNNAIRDNPHGWGIMAHHPSRGMTVKRGMTDASFWKAWRKVGSQACVIHFRWATHGSKGLHNCHPFEILDGKYAVMHNGVISTPIRDTDRSDTYHFAEYVIGPILAANPALFGTDYLAEMLGRLAGSYNKLAIMRRDGAAMLVNADEGIEHEGLWLSNDQSIPFAPSATLRYSLNAWDQCDNFTEDECAALRRHLLRDTAETDKDRLAPIGFDDVPGSHGAAALATTRGPVYSLGDMADWCFEDVAEYCRDDPESVAALICEAFGSW